MSEDERANRSRALSDLKVESGPAALAKMQHREESRQAYLRRPIAERLRIAVSMVGQRGDDPRR